MQIKIIENPEVWDKFLIQLNKNTFLQSLGWIKFNQDYGHKTWQLGLFDQGKLVSTAFIFKIEAKRGRFLFCPHGPQMLELKLQYLQFWTKYFYQLAKQENCAFVRISPIENNTPQNRNLFTLSGYRHAPIHMHAELTTVLDITGSKDDILARIKKNARYDIRKAERLLQQNELKIDTADEITDEIYEVYQETFVRGDFVPFSKKYLQAELEAFQIQGECELIAIRKNDQLISWGLVVFFGQRAFYHQGANLLFKGIPAPTLLQWTAIQQANSKGCVSYDFWGVSPADNSKHPWTAISKFKRSFGGQDVALLPAQDLVVSPFKYIFTWVLESARKIKRGF